MGASGEQETRRHNNLQTQGVYERKPNCSRKITKYQLWMSDTKNASVHVNMQNTRSGRLLRTNLDCSREHAKKLAVDENKNASSGFQELVLAILTV